jgi:predicted dehydrogenase
MRVVAVFPSVSDDIPESVSHVPQYAEEMRKAGVEIVDSIPALLDRVDAVLIESIDGRKHLEQARPVIAAGKPLFIDKPVGGSLAEAMEIYRLAAEKNVPCFSSSSLRFSPAIVGMVNDPKIGKVLGCDAFSPCSLEIHHPDLFWYGVHGVEILFTLMGPGCQTVSRTHTEDTELVVGVWKDGRIGTFRGSRKGPHSYGAMVFGSKSITRSGDFGGYEPLAVEIAKFFRSGKPPVSAAITQEMFAFMEAADESKRQGGKPVALEQVLETARKASAQAHQATDAGQWQAGLAEAIITPEHPMPMGGYGSRTQPANGKLHDLKAKALVFEDAQGQRGVLVTMDLVGISRQFSVDVCQRIEKQYAVPRAAVALSVSHTHCGPQMAGNLTPILALDAEQQELVNQYSAGLADRLVQVVGEAIQNLVAAQLSAGTGTAGFAANRRNNPEPEVPQRRAEGRLVGPVDYDVPVLKITGADGHLRAIVFGYACHATTLQEQTWSGDWPGFAQLELEQRHSGTMAFFWAGCGADQNPLPRKTVELAQAYGRQMADSVDTVLGQPMQSIAPRLETAYEEIDLPFSQLPSREELNRAATGTDYAARRAKLLLADWDRQGQLSPTYPYPVQIWRMGNELEWIFLGGEVVVDYSLRLKNSPSSANGPQLRPWVASYSNDVMAYIPSRRVLVEGGYEGGGAMAVYGQPSPWDQSVEERIVQEVQRLRDRVAARN